jgi:hypothetical protein
VRIKHNKAQAPSSTFRHKSHKVENIIKIIHFAHPETATWLENKLRITKNIISRFEKDEDDLAFSV